MNDLKTELVINRPNVHLGENIFNRMLLESKQIVPLQAQKKGNYTKKQYKS